MCNLSKGLEEEVCKSRFERAYKSAYEKAFKKSYKKRKLHYIIKVMDYLELTVGQAMDILKISDDDKPECEELVKKVKSLLNDENDKEVVVSSAFEEESWIDDLIGVIPNADFLGANKEFEMFVKENKAIKKLVVEDSILSHDELTRLYEAREEVERLKKMASERYQANIAEELASERHRARIEEERRFKIGEKRGIALAKKVMKLSLENKNPQVIADYCEVSLETVQEILE